MTNDYDWFDLGRRIVDRRLGETYCRACDEEHHGQPCGTVPCQRCRLPVSDLLPKPVCHHCEAFDALGLGQE